MLLYDINPIIYSLNVFLFVDGSPVINTFIVNNVDVDVIILHDTNDGLGQLNVAMLGFLI